MRLATLTAAAGVGVLAACAQMEPAPAAHPPSAVSVQRYAAPATETPQVGYSAGARRLADCLASYPNYDYRTDEYQAAPGVTRRCPL